MTARLGKGFFDPVASPTKESLRALLWNLQSRGFPSPCTLDRDVAVSAIRGIAPSLQRSLRAPLKPIDRCFGSGFDQRAFMPFGNQIRAYDP
jgi:hypothetical protein